MDTKSKISIMDEPTITVSHRNDKGDSDTYLDEHNQRVANQNAKLLIQMCLENCTALYLLVVQS